MGKSVGCQLRLPPISSCFWSVNETRFFSFCCWWWSRVQFYIQSGMQQVASYQWPWKRKEVQQHTNFRALRETYTHYFSIRQVGHRVWAIALMKCWKANQSRCHLRIWCRHLLILISLTSDHIRQIGSVANHHHEAPVLSEINLRLLMSHWRSRHYQQDNKPAHTLLTPEATDHIPEFFESSWQIIYPRSFLISVMPRITFTLTLTSQKYLVRAYTLSFTTALS